jgi:ParB-like chromosome segregation protein Spo0J
MAVKKDPKTLELTEPFVSLFPVDETTLGLVTAAIRERGFDPDKPILLWKDAFGSRGRQVVIDGHTRLKAALTLKLPEVWCTVRQYRNLDAAITAGIGEQVQRRNLNREQIAAYVVSILPLLDETRDGLRTRTAKQLAALLGVSVPTVDRARGVLASGDEELIDAVKSGSTSLLAAYTELTGGSPPPVEESRQVAVEHARQVAAVPQDVFDEYLENDPRPTREGLLRYAADAQPPAPELSRDEENTYNDIAQLVEVISELDHAGQALAGAERLVVELMLAPQFTKSFSERTDEAFDRITELTEATMPELALVIVASDLPAKDVARLARRLPMAAGSLVDLVEAARG